MEYLPLFLDLRERRCVVVGGDETAARKAELLLRAGAKVTVAAPGEVCATLRGWAREGRLALEPGPLGAGALEDCMLCVVALADADAAHAAAALARRHVAVVNVVDRPELCTCIVPAIVDRSPVVVAVSTAGAAPVLGRLLRARLEALLPARLGELATLARTLRPRVAERLPGPARRRFWEQVLSGPVAEMVFRGQAQAAREAMLARLEDTAADTGGEAYLVPVPAGCDPEDVTLRALRLLQQADVAVHDADLPAAVLDLVRRDAQRMPRDAGRAPAEVAALLRELAGDGRRVAWLSAAARNRQMRESVRAALSASGIGCQIAC